MTSGSSPEVAPRATTQLRAHLAAGTVSAAGCFDALSARLAEYVGFEALHLSGSGVESALLGAPDMGITTLTELTDVVARISSATRVPLICDIDTGFGGVHNVQRTIREMIRAGAAGVHIEDQIVPKRSPFVAGRTLLPREQASQRVAAAVAARTDPDFVIVARTDADEISIAELIERSNLYLEAGADCAFPMLTKYKGEMIGSFPLAEQLEVCETLTREIAGPVMMMAGFASDNMPNTQQMADTGAAIVILPIAALSAASNAMLSVLRELHEKGTVTDYFRAHPENEELAMGGIYNLVGLPAYLDVERRFGV